MVLINLGGMLMADCAIIDSMKEFSIAKMRESTFDSEELMLEFQEHNYRMLGDEEAFMVYYYIAPNTIWVHFLWASNKRKMLKICKELWAESVEKESMILFDCDDYAKMFGNHAEKLYVWNKEI